MTDLKVILVHKGALEYSVALIRGHGSVSLDPLTVEYNHDTFKFHLAGGGELSFPRHLVEFQEEHR